MSTIFSKLTGLVVYSYVDANRNVKDLVLLPDFNFEVDPKAVEFAKQHPLFQKHLEKGLLSITEEIDSLEHTNSIKLADSKEFGEGKVVTKNSDISFDAEYYKPTVESLTKYQGVGVKTAKAILATMPEAGWVSRVAFVEQTKSFDIDWSLKK